MEVKELESITWRLYMTNSAAVGRGRSIFENLLASLTQWYSNCCFCSLKPICPGLFTSIYLSIYLNQFLSIYLCGFISCYINYLKLFTTIYLNYCNLSIYLTWSRISFFLSFFLWGFIPIKKLDGNYTRMLRAILNKSWRQHSTKHQLYGHLPPITKSIQVRRARHAGHCWRSRDELISDVLLWTPTHGRAKAGRPARTYIEQLSEDTGCSPEDLPEAMNDREKWWERVRDIGAGGTTWWRWWSHPNHIKLLTTIPLSKSS